MSEVKSCNDLGRILEEKEKLRKYSRIHFVHWIVLISSLLLTFGAWYFTKTQVEEKTKGRFNSQSRQLVELVTERMKKYEDALWSGVAAIHAQGGDTNLEHWKKFADNMRIVEKYPGINGMGVIHYLPNKKSLDEYLDVKRKERSDYKIKPKHNKTEFWPITYIEPVSINKAAVGLDMAHEINRYTAAKKARDTADAQITGPIILVQDSEKTPGFLFYVPFYQSGNDTNTHKRKEKFVGLVYAPFIMKKLMEGTLEEEKRHIGVKISDGTHILYDEHDVNYADFDSRPMFEDEVLVQMYGRTWVFHIQTKKSFREASSNNQPIMILVGGIIIDILLLVIFVLLSKANHKAIEFSDRVTKNYKMKLSENKEMMKKLEKTNKEMESFVYIASHDLRSPLINLQGFTAKILEYLKKIEPLLQKNDTNLSNEEQGLVRSLLEEKIPQASKIIQENVIRMDVMTDSILQLSRIGRRELRLETLNINDIVHSCISTISESYKDNLSEIKIEALPDIIGDKVSIEQIFEGLIDNSARYVAQERMGALHISYSDKGKYHEFSISDNGRGIADGDKDKVFAIFRRGSNVVADTEGKGMGLSYVKSLVEKHGGDIWFESNFNQGTTFFFTVKKNIKVS